MRLLPIATAFFVLSAPALARDGEVFFRRKSNQLLIGPNTELRPTNCTTAADGTVSCDVQIVNPDDPSNRYRTLEN